MADTPFWETSLDDAAPAVIDAPPRKRATAADFRRAAEHRRQVHERARQALAATSLPTDAAEAIPWEIVARRTATAFAPAIYTTWRIGQYTANALRQAGITIQTLEDLATPEAQAALAQAKTDDFELAPADPAVLHDLETEQANTLTTMFMQNEAYRRQAGMLLLIEAWASLTPNNSDGNDAAITTSLSNRLAEPDGWEWLAGFPIDLSTLADEDDGNWNTERTRNLGTIPAFNAEGYGRVDNSIVPVSARLAMVAAWPGPKSQHPEFHFGNGAGKAVYAPSEKAFPLVEDAWRLVDTLDDAHVDTFDYILTKALANQAKGQRDEYGSFTVTREEILDARGIQKAKNGGHKSENLAEVGEHVDRLSQLVVRASINVWSKSGRSKREKQETLTVEAPLIMVPKTVYRTALDGKKVPIAWHLRPGDWAIDMERFGPPLAIMMQGILKLHARNDAHAKRIGRYLVYQFRVRAAEQSWRQPYRIETLLNGAGVDVDRNNPARFRRRVEAALDTLTNPVAMGDGPICIASWSYPDPTPARGRNWIDRWLASGIIIVPPETITRQYTKRLGKQSKHPRELATG